MLSATSVRPAIAVAIFAASAVEAQVVRTPVKSKTVISLYNRRVPRTEIILPQVKGYITDLITSLNSPPYAPAFINTAPPTVPGIPYANSIPLKPS